MQVKQRPGNEDETQNRSRDAKTVSRHAIALLSVAADVKEGVRVPCQPLLDGPLIISSEGGVLPAEHRIWLAGVCQRDIRTRNRVRPSYP